MKACIAVLIGAIVATAQAGFLNTGLYGGLYGYSVPFNYGYNYGYPTTYASYAPAPLIKTYTPTVVHHTTPVVAKVVAKTIVPAPVVKTISYASPAPIIRTFAPTTLAYSYAYPYASTYGYYNSYPYTYGAAFIGKK